jgi:paired amphipathic helix protein Sin3a
MPQNMGSIYYTDEMRKIHPSLHYHIQPLSPPRPPQLTRSHHPSPRHRTTSNNDENRFFDNVKRALDNREVYNEFLKVINLFTQDYINTATLIKESRHFLNEGDLMRQLKEIVNWDDRKERENWLQEQQHRGLNRLTLGSVLDRRSRADMNVQYGSYRKLPASVSLHILASAHSVKLKFSVFFRR